MNRDGRGGIAALFSIVMQNVAIALVPVATGLLAVPACSALADAALFAILISGLALLGLPLGAIYAFDSVLLPYLIAIQTVLLSYAMGLLVFGRDGFRAYRGIRVGWGPLLTLFVYTLFALFHALFPDSVALFVIYVILIALGAILMPLIYSWWLHSRRAEGFYWLFLMLLYLLLVVVTGSLQYTQHAVFVPAIVLVSLILVFFIVVAVLYATRACASCQMARDNDGFVRIQDQEIAKAAKIAANDGDDSKLD